MSTTDRSVSGAFTSTTFTDEVSGLSVKPLLICCRVAHCIQIAGISASISSTRRIYSVECAPVEVFVNERLSCEANASAVARLPDVSIPRRAAWLGAISTSVQRLSSKQKIACGQEAIPSGVYPS